MGFFSQGAPQEGAAKTKLKKKKKSHQTKTLKKKKVMMLRGPRLP
jgi:hypothetical protein